MTRQLRAVTGWPACCAGGDGARRGRPILIARRILRAPPAHALRLQQRITAALAALDKQPLAAQLRIVNTNCPFGDTAIEAVE